MIANPVASWEDLRALRPLEDPAASLPFVGATLRALRAEVGPRAAVLGFAPTPWTLAGYVVEGKADRRARRAKTMLLREPELLTALLDSLADAIAAHLEYQVANGAQVLQLFDSWAHHLTPAQYAAFGLRQTERILRRLAVSAPSVPVILHTNGCAGKLPTLARLPAAVLSVDWQTDLADVRRACAPRSMVLQGNVDPMVLFGREADIAAAVRDCLSAAGVGRHIMNVGNGVIDGTPEEAVAQFVSLTKGLSSAVIA